MTNEEFNREVMSALAVGSDKLAGKKLYFNYKPKKESIFGYVHSKHVVQNKQHGFLNTVSIVLTTNRSGTEFIMNIDLEDIAYEDIYIFVPSMIKQLVASPHPVEITRFIHNLPVIIKMQFNLGLPRQIIESFNVYGLRDLVRTSSADLLLHRVNKTSCIKTIGFSQVFYLKALNYNKGTPIYQGAIVCKVLDNGYIEYLYFEAGVVESPLDNDKIVIIPFIVYKDMSVYVPLCDVHCNILGKPKPHIKFTDEQIDSIFIDALVDEYSTKDTIVNKPHVADFQNWISKVFDRLSDSTGISCVFSNKHVSTSSFTYSFYFWFCQINGLNRVKNSDGKDILYIGKCRNKVIIELYYDYNYFTNTIVYFTRLAK